MILSLDIVADNALATTRFACDLSACKGACCTTPGGRGAPLEDSEVKMIEEATPAALKYLSDRNRRIIAEGGGVEGEPGDYATRCIDNRDCVFVMYEGEVAKCAIERAFFNGETSFRKPISCHLFPIRSTRLLDGAYLRYERIPECEPARKLGRQQDVPLYIFLKEALIRAYGEEYYQQLVATIEGDDNE
jgi:hypothetical protein